MDFSIFYQDATTVIPSSKINLLNESPLTKSLSFAEMAKRQELGMFTTRENRRAATIINKAIDQSSNILNGVVLAQNSVLEKKMTLQDVFAEYAGFAIGVSFVIIFVLLLLIYSLLVSRKKQMADGRVLDGHDFIGEPQKGRVITIISDTRHTPAAVELAEDADVLIHEGTFAKDEIKMARSYYHSTSGQAAMTAKKSHAKKLLLTHISARYTGKAAYQLAYQVRDIFPATRVVNDFDIVDVPFK